MGIQGLFIEYKYAMELHGMIIGFCVTISSIFISSFGRRRSQFLNISLDRLVPSKLITLLFQLLSLSFNRKQRPSGE